MLEGQVFELRTWRRDGLIARLRERGFHVSTLVDQIDALPAPPPPHLPGPPGWRPLAGFIERYSIFDPRLLRWEALEPEVRDGVSGVVVPAGAALRRRKGRGQPVFHQAIPERGGGIGLQPLDETSAILRGYAQAYALDPRPLLVEAQGERILLPVIELPPEYRAILRRLAAGDDQGLSVSRQTWPLAQRLFARLGVELTLE